jgi:hypothetical protein
MLLLVRLTIGDSRASYTQSGRKGRPAWIAYELVISDSLSTKEASLLQFAHRNRFTPALHSPAESRYGGRRPNLDNLWGNQFRDTRLKEKDVRQSGGF